MQGFGMANFSSNPPRMLREKNLESPPGFQKLKKLKSWRAEMLKLLKIENVGPRAGSKWPQVHFQDQA